MHKLIQASVFAAIGVLVFASLLIPFVDSGTAETLTIKNTGSYFTTPDEGEHTVIVDANTITYDGNACVYPDLSLYGSATVAIGADWFVRLEWNTAHTTVSYVVAGPPQQYVNLGNSSSGALTISINSNEVTLTGPNNSITRTGLEYIIADKGNYVMSHDPYVKNDTEFIGAIRQATSVDLFEIVKGTISDVSTYQSIIPRVYRFTPGETGSVTNMTYTVTLNDVTTDLKKLDVINESATAVFNSGNVDLSVTIDYIIVPVSVVYTNPGYAGDDVAQVLGVLPLILIFALIMGVLGYAVYTRIE